MIGQFADLAVTALRFIAFLVVAAGLAQVLLSLVHLTFAVTALRRLPPREDSSVLWQRYADLAPPIAVIAPAYNEELTIEESVKALLALHYPNFEVIVCNDGSKDSTLQVLMEKFGVIPVQRYHDIPIPCELIRGIYANPAIPNLLVVDKENGGKADAMNAGINVARTPVVCVIDADTLLEADSLLRIVRPFIEEPLRTVAVGGTIRIANGCRVHAGRVVEARLPRSFLALVQVVEYLRAFLVARLGMTQMQTLLIVSGAFGVFRRDAVLQVGGFSRKTVGEDMELCVKLHRYMRDHRKPYRISYVAEPVSWTEAPENLSSLGNQRSRWQRGTLENFFKHRDMFLNPRYGRIGILGLGQVFVIDVLGPIFEILGYSLLPVMWLMGILRWEILIAFLGLIFSFGVLLSVSSLVLEEILLRRLPRARDLFILTLISVLENLGYRQLNNYWRMRGWWQFLRKQQTWGGMVRKGFTAS